MKSRFRNEAIELKVQDKTVSVYSGESKTGPVVYLNTVRGEGKSVWKACFEAGCPSFTLVAISGLDWDHDMSPWAIPPITPRDNPCSGGADEFLKVLTVEIVPAAENAAGIRPRFRALAGYSLGGLFAVYSVYRTDMFTRIASASGSMWFPGFYDFAASSEMKADVSRMYFSLGDLESRTRNSYLSPVQEETERIASFIKGQGIDSIFELNRGNHYKNPNARMAKGIAWILKESEEKK